MRLRRGERGGGGHLAEEEEGGGCAFLQLPGPRDIMKERVKRGDRQKGKEGEG